MLNEQQIPLSVGDGTKIASQGIEKPFHWQYLLIKKKFCNNKIVNKYFKFDFVVPEDSFFSGFS